jgi:hypothetical protein
MWAVGDGEEDAGEVVVWDPEVRQRGLPLLSLEQVSPVASNTQQRSRLLVFESLTSWKTTYGSRNLPPRRRENSLQKGIVLSLRRTQCISAHSDNMPADRCYL